MKSTTPSIREMLVFCLSVIASLLALIGFVNGWVDGQWHDRYRWTIGRAVLPTHYIGFHLVKFFDREL